MRKKELREHIKIKKRVNKLFVGNLTKNGNKLRAQKIFNGALNLLKLRLRNRDAFRFILFAVGRVSPRIRLRNKRFGAFIHKLPYFLPPRKAKSYAIRWIVEGARLNFKDGLSFALFKSIVDALKFTGYAWKKKNEVHGIALSNRIYMRY
jgi:small subunit ribosomal protein S7